MEFAGLKLLLQRVSEANVRVEGSVVGEIGQGLLVFLGIEHGDDKQLVDKMVNRLLAYRVFSDSEGKMNLSVSDIAASVLLVSQFTLAADTKKGLRPGFSKAAKPDEAKQLYEYMADVIDKSGVRISTGRFGADMKVSLTNDGPVTFMLEMCA